MLAGGHLFDETLIDRINMEIRENPGLSRYGLSHQVCEWLDWQGVDGRVKAMSCRVALLKLHRRGLIELPAAKQGLFTSVATKPSAFQVCDNYAKSPIRTLHIVQQTTIG